MNALIILDGFGNNPDDYGNAINKAEKPFFDSLMKKFPNTLINASGYAVGLPEGQMGNSEVGHLNLGAGQGRVSGHHDDRRRGQERHV